MKALFVIITFSVISGGGIRNTSFTLYEVYTRNGNQAYELKTFGDFCRATFTSEGLRKYPVEVMVPKTAEEIFGQYLICKGMDFNMLFEGSPSQYNLPKLRTSYNVNFEKGNINFEKYHRFDVIRSYLQSLVQRYPNKATLEKIGESDEGRDLMVIKISSGGSGTKPMIYIDGGIHGNEWISPAQAVYIIQQLVENPSNSYLVRNVDWLIFPVVNPDGYEFSLSVDPKFRKTRSKGINCIGVDPNRNFNLFWGLNFGSSSNECDETYHGRRPFSEPETRAIRDLILKYSPRIKLYLSFHCSSQMFLYPWSHSRQPPLDVNELFSLGKRVASAIEMVSGTHYEVGQIPHLLYAASGDSISWAKGVAGIDLSYAIELPPKDVNVRLPLSCIKFVVLEMFEGIKTFHEYIEYKYSKMRLQPLFNNFVNSYMYVNK